MRMNNTSEINFNNDWKVITVMIGNNDICEFCINESMHSGDRFLDHLREALDYLHAQNALRNVLGKSRYDTKEDFTVVLQPFMRSIQIPFLQDGSVDTSFFISDGFHPSQKFHSQLARALWNNMLQPLGNKQEFLDLGVDIPLMCPQSVPNVPYFRTTKNSDYKYPDWIGDQDWGSNFPCDVTHSNKIPTSAHKLRPADIKVVAALGDWITTGLGASPDNGSWMTTWRGLSWRDLPAQARELLEKLETAPEINIETDWKLITIFIGINDLCDFCSHQLPRVYINLVEIMQVAPLYQNQGGKCARPVVSQTNCPCFRNPVDSPVARGLKELNEKFQTKIFNLTSMTQYQKREDFVMIAQPFFRESIFPPDNEGHTDSRYFSDDCFHFSSLTHNQMAIALWNNMMEPVGSKSTSHNFIFDENRILCPSSKRPYFFTEKNSPSSKRKKWWRFWILISLMLFFLPVLITTLVVVADREGILGPPGN